MTHSSLEVFPESIQIEEIDILGFKSTESFFQRLLYELKKPQQAVISYLNVHVSNSAYLNPELKTFLQTSDFVYCDGAGIQLGAALQNENIPLRFPAADWIMDFFKRLSAEGKTVFLLGGEPGVSHKMRSLLDEKMSNHPLVGAHHGYFLNDPKQEEDIIENINQISPDVLIVGLGTPLQEKWIQEHRHELNVSLILPLGAVMDYFTEQTHRCPQWLGDIGFEWLYRLCLEPRRMAGRYVIGNPWFVSRILGHALYSKIQQHALLTLKEITNFTKPNASIVTGLSVSKGDT